MSAASVGSKNIPTTSPWSIFSQSAGPLNGNDVAVVFAAGVLNALKAPVTQDNLNFLFNWMKAEGGGGEWNPLNTTLREPGSLGLAGNTSGVQAYGTFQQGIAATASTLQSSYYTGILGALKGGNAEQVNLSGGFSSELKTWSGGGYGQVGNTPAPSIGKLGNALKNLPNFSYNPSQNIGQAIGDVTSAAVAPLAGIAGDVASGIVAGLKPIGSALLPYLIRFGLAIVGAVLLVLALHIAADHSDPDEPVDHHTGEHLAEAAAA